MTEECKLGGRWVVREIAKVWPDPALSIGWQPPTQDGYPLRINKAGRQAAIPIHFPEWELIHVEHDSDIQRDDCR